LWIGERMQVMARAELAQLVQLVRFHELELDHCREAWEKGGVASLLGFASEMACG